MSSKEGRPPRESVGIQQGHDNTCFTCGRYVAPNEGAIEHEFDSVICPDCIKRTTRGDYRTDSGHGLIWVRGKKKQQEKHDPEAYHIGGDLRFSGHGEQG